MDPSDAAKSVAADYDVPLFSTAEDYLTAHRPDGIVIATPNHLHTDQAGLCLDASVPVLIEKPLADRLANADRVVARAAETGVPVLVGHHRPHTPIIARAKEAVTSGLLGDIVAVNGHFWLYKPDDYFEATWRKGPGAGPTLINLIHDIDLLRHLCGEITEVQAMRSDAARGNAVEDTAATLLRFDNGALGTFTMSDTAVAPWSWEMTSRKNPIYPQTAQSCYTLGGTQASLSIPDLHLWRHDGPRSWWNPISTTQLNVDHADAFVLQIAHFLDVIAGAAPRVSAQEGRNSLATVLQVVDAPVKGAQPI